MARPAANMAVIGPSWKLLDQWTQLLQEVEADELQWSVLYHFNWWQQKSLGASTFISREPHGILTVIFQFIYLFYFLDILLLTPVGILYLCICFETWSLVFWDTRLVRACWPHNHLFSNLIYYSLSSMLNSTLKMGCRPLDGHDYYFIVLKVWRFKL